jgi:hypothetical protein
MIFTEEQQREFEKVTIPVINFINKYGHPHVSVIVTPVNAELLEGVCSTGEVGAELCSICSAPFGKSPRYKVVNSPDEYTHWHCIMNIDQTDNLPKNPSSLTPK